MRYAVGQIIYVILNKKGQVYPMRIIEEITKKTLSGEEVNYVLQVGKDSAATMLLNDVEGEIYETPEEARTVLIERATRQIEKIVSLAYDKSKEWYQQTSSQLQQSLQEIHELPPPVITKDNVVTLPDGTVARLKLPNEDI